jgi:heat shock protein HspQ
MATLSSSPRFESGQIVAHKRFGYRGVVIGVDAQYEGSDAWYEASARSRPPRNQPWYHVLIHDTMHEAYVAERNLELADSPAPVEHPLVWVFFDGVVGGRYVRNRLMN